MSAKCGVQRTELTMQAAVSGRCVVKIICDDHGVVSKILQVGGDILVFRAIYTQTSCGDTLIEKYNDIWCCTIRVLLNERGITLIDTLFYQWVWLVRIEDKAKLTETVTFFPVKIF